MREYLKLGLILMLVGALAALALGVTFTMTKEQIDKQAVIKQNKANSSVLDAKTFTQIKADELKEAGIKLVNEQDKIFEAKNGAILVGYAIVVHPRGYGGLMEIAIGIADSKVNGVSMISNKETPGLGDAVFKPKFIKQYLGKTPKDPVEVKKDIDAVTGATISSKALTKGVRTALDYYKELTVDR